MNPYPYPDGAYTFVHDAGKSYHDGKSYWPALLRLRLTQREALRVIEFLARQLRLPETAEAPTFIFSGTLTKDEEEEADSDRP